MFDLYTENSDFLTFNFVSTHQATSLSSQLSKFEDKKRKHVQTLERKTSNMKQMFKKGKGEIIPLLIG